MRARRLGRFPASFRTRSPSSCPRSVATWVVLAGREAHRQLGVGPSIQLRRSPRAGTLTAGEPAELGGEQPVGDEPVEVERGHGPGHTHSGGGLVLADGVGPAADESVQGPSLRLGQGGHAGDLFFEVVAGHWSESRRRRRGESGEAGQRAEPTGDVAVR